MALPGEQSAPFYADMSVYKQISNHKNIRNRASLLLKRPTFPLHSRSFIWFLLLFQTFEKTGERQALCTRHRQSCFLWGRRNIGDEFSTTMVPFTGLKTRLPARSRRLRGLVESWSDYRWKMISISNNKAWKWRRRGRFNCLCSSFISSLSIGLDCFGMNAIRETTGPSGNHWQLGLDLVVRRSLVWYLWVTSLFARKVWPGNFKTSGSFNEHFRFLC